MRVFVRKSSVTEFVIITFFLFICFCIDIKNNSKFYCRTWAMSRGFSRISKSLDCVKEITFEVLNDLIIQFPNAYKKIYKLDYPKNGFISVYYFDSDFIFKQFFESFNSVFTRSRKVLEFINKQKTNIILCQD